MEGAFHVEQDRASKLVGNVWRKTVRLFHVKQNRLRKYSEQSH